MADYYTRSVITESVNLDAIMEMVLMLRGAEVDPEGEETTVLDALVHGREIRSCSVVFENGWDENDPEDLIEWREPAPDSLDNDERSELDRLLALEEHEFLREVLKINPQHNFIEVQSAWSCSKMRLDGFGGCGLIVTRKGYLYVITTNTSITEDGVATFDGKFIPWDEPQPTMTEEERELIRRGDSEGAFEAVRQRLGGSREEARRLVYKWLRVEEEYQRS